MINKILSLVKFSHTIFALPFAMIGFALGVRVAGFEWMLLIQIVLCMVLARSAAMAFNRLVDAEYDAQNPRTAMREIPAGKLSIRLVSWIVIGCSVAFMVVALSINFLCFFLSPIALAVVLGYSYTKRFTSLCHLVLGLGLAIAPMGAYVAVTGAFGFLPLLFSGLVLTWVAAFDVIFALQDTEFDRSEKLFSIPSKLGIKKALVVSALMHTTTVGFVVWIGLVVDPRSDLLYWIGATVFVALLAFQHVIVKPTDLSRVGMAFGTTNGVASVAYATFTVLALFL